jgi:hypothetical protein
LREPASILVCFFCAAVDQLSKFNSRLADLAQGHQTHLIDGIVLTKFDTIDEKVSADPVA